MSIFSTIESYWQKDEQWVLTFLTELRADVQVAEDDVKAFWAWIGAHMSEITAGVTLITNTVTSIKAAGLPVPAVANSAINDVNVAVAALNAAVNASNAGANTAATLIAGYQAAKTAAATVNTALGEVGASAAPVAIAPIAAGPAQGSGA